MNTPLYKLTTTDNRTGRAYNPTQVGEARKEEILADERYTVHTVEKMRLSAEQTLNQVTGFGKPY